MCSSTFYNSNYYPFGMQMPGRNHNSSDYRFGYQGSEKDDELKTNGNNYFTENRILDPRLGRWLSMDPKPIASESPYVSMSNNPIINTDIYGDVADLVVKGKSSEKEKAAAVEAIKTLVGDLEAKTGFDLYLTEKTNAKTGDKIFTINYTADTKGKPTIDKDPDGNLIGSAKARKLLKSVIDDSQTLTTTFNIGKGTETDLGGNSSNLDPFQIKKNMASVNNADPTVAGFALVYFHEVLHSGVGGFGFDDPAKSRGFGPEGRVVRRVNMIQKELGPRFGIRTSYRGIGLDFKKGSDKRDVDQYVPLSKKAEEMLKNGQIPSGEPYFIRHKR